MSTFKRLLLLLPLVLLLLPSTALAVESGPQWTVTSVSLPTNFAPGQETVSYRVTVTNTGGASSDGSLVTITDELPAGLTLAPGGAQGENTLSATPQAGFSCALRTCTFTGAVVPDQTLDVTFPVIVARDAPASLTNIVRVHGGGAPDAAMETPTTISEQPAGFGISPGGASTSLSSTQAGAHPDITTSIAFNTVTPQGALAAPPKNTIDELPPGFAGDLVDTPSCSAANFSLGECPNSTQIGVTTLSVIGLVEGVETIPVYNLAPEPGELAKIGFSIGNYRFEGAITLRPGDYGLDATFENAKQSGIELESVSLTVWGVPANPRHDLLRGLRCAIAPGVGDGFCEHVNHSGTISGPIPVASESALAPYFTNPTSCGSLPLQARFEVTSWEHQSESESPEATPMSVGPIVGCDRLTIEPTLEAQPSSSSAESATGLDVRLGSEQHYDNANGVAASNLDGVTVTLPEGMSVNPSAGSGLGDCSEAQFAYEGSTYEPAPGSGCPSDSKLGTVHALSPSIAEEASGSLFLATPYENRFGALIAVYVVVRIPNRGVVVTAAGKVAANPVTGQLTTTFQENPQLPFNAFSISFRQGQTSPLITPPTCGTFASTGVLTPWSVPLQEHLVSSSFEVTSGVHGGPCPSGGVPPFKPQVISGTQNNAGGTYSPFYLRIVREDGEQEITRFSTTLPPGLTGNLTGIPFCPEADIEAAKSVTGAQEEASPSCPAASEIGHTIVTAGVGGVLAQTPGRIYLAGPYHGAPLVGRLGHEREGRPVRPRDGRDPFRAGHQPEHRPGRSQRRAIGPDPPHHRRDRRARPRNPRLHGPRKVHRQPD